jgi:hypothetical protein
LYAVTNFAEEYTASIFRMDISQFGKLAGYTKCEKWNGSGRIGVAAWSQGWVKEKVVWVVQWES